MKKTAIFALAFLLLFFCSCTAKAPLPQSQSGQSVQPLVLQDENLIFLRESLLSSSAAFSVILPGEEGQISRVESNPDLLAAFANALCYGQGVLQTNEEVSQEQGQVPAQDSIAIISTEPYIGLSLAPPLGQDFCVAMFEMQGKILKYSYPKSIYAHLQELAGENLVKNTLEIDGDFVPLKAPQPQAELVQTQWQECKAGLVALYTWRMEPENSKKTSAIGIFNAESGEVTYYKELGLEALRIEPANFAACNMRAVLEDGTMWYFNTEAPEERPYYFYLPKALQDRLLAPYPQDRAVFRSYDGGTGQGAVWAVVDEEGITWARRKANGSVENSIIMENLPKELLSGQAQPAAQFGQVRVMNGGKTLVATVVLPYSQIGNCGIFTLDIQTKTENWYFGMFKPMLADLRFLTDTSLCVAAEDEIFWLDVASGKTSTTSPPKDIISAHTANYQDFVFETSRQNPDGTMSTSFTLEQGQKPLIVGKAGFSQQGALQVEGITENFLLLKGQNMGQESWVLTKTQ